METPKTLQQAIIFFSNPDNCQNLAMRVGSFEKLGGHVEVDETFIGGKVRNMHRADRARKTDGTGGCGKVAVMGLLERHGEVRTMVVPNVRRKSLRREIKNHIEPGSMVNSDALKSYNDLNNDYIHNESTTQRSTSRATFTRTA